MRNLLKIAILILLAALPAFAQDKPYKRIDALTLPRIASVGVDPEIDKRISANLLINQLYSTFLPRKDTRGGMTWKIWFSIARSAHYPSDVVLEASLLSDRFNVLLVPKGRKVVFCHPRDKDDTFEKIGTCKELTAEEVKEAEVKYLLVVIPVDLPLPEDALMYKLGTTERLDPDEVRRTHTEIVAKQIVDRIGGDYFGLGRPLGPQPKITVTKKTPTKK